MRNREKNIDATSAASVMSETRSRCGQTDSRSPIPETRLVRKLSKLAPKVESSKVSTFRPTLSTFLAASGCKFHYLKMTDEFLTEEEVETENSKVIYS